MAISTVATALVMIFICLTITTTTARPPPMTTTAARSPPMSVFGICNKLGTFHIPRNIEKTPKKGEAIKMWTQAFTKVQWKVSEGKIVVKFKVGLEKLCKNISEAMKNVEGDLHRMLFWKKRVQVSS